MAVASGIDDGAEEESGDWGTGSEENAVVLDSVHRVRLVDITDKMKAWRY